MTRRKRLTKAGLLLGSSLLALALAEGLLWLIGFSYTPLRVEVVQNWSEWRHYHSTEDRNYVYDPDLIWRPRPGPPVFNAQGYRGEELAAEKRPGDYRILALGDSNTLGWVGAGDANWPAYLQGSLRARDRGVTVINAGAYGYSSFQGLRRFREALALRPDLVLVSFGANDAMMVTASDAEFAARKVRSLDLDKALMKLRTGQLFLSVTDKLSQGGKGEPVPRVSLQEYKENLEEIIRVAQENGVKVVLLTRPFTGESPHGGWWKNYAPAYNAAVREVAEGTRTPCIDVYAHFAAEQAYFIDESHFTQKGHRVMAELIHDEIRPLLPGPAGGR
jgi:lysophospholipase L1-like esterase